MVPPVPMPATKHVDLAAGVVPDFFRRGAAVDLRVGGVLELLRDHRAGRRGGDLLRLGDGAAHALGALGQHELGAEDAQHLAPLDAHRLRHRRG